jgi:hypothetical protein
MYVSIGCQKVECVIQPRTSRYIHRSNVNGLTAATDDWNTRANAESCKPDQGRIKIPTSADEAEGMVKIGLHYLKECAPERLVLDKKTSKSAY